MNHPKPEEWAPYVFGEAAPETRRRLDAHLHTCADCRAEIATWQRTLRRLDTWKLPSSRAPVEVFAPLLKWAVAAAVVLCFGFGLGRLTAAKVDVASLRSALEPQLRRQLQQDQAQMVHEQTDHSASTTLAAAGKQTEQALTVWTAALENRRASENQALLTALEKMQTQHLADYLRLKKDIDTVAVNTDAGLRQTEQQLVELAADTPDKTSTPPQQ